MRLTVCRNDAGQPGIGPSGVDDQSNALMRADISPSCAGRECRCASVCEGLPMLEVVRRGSRSLRWSANAFCRLRRGQKAAVVGSTPPAIKDPDDWVTGEERMTGAQASYLKTLSEEAHDDRAFDSELTKAEASKRIDALKEKTGR